MELPLKKRKDIIGKWNMCKDGPDIQNVFWTPQVFLIPGFWEHLDDKARTEGRL